MRASRAAMIITLLIAMSASSLAVAQPLNREPARPFRQGKFGFSLGMATGGFGSNRYYVVSGSVGVFVLEGLEVALAGEQWFGADPSISKLSPQVRYIAAFVPAVHPYLGAFYRHWFVGDPFDDIDTVGGRLGAVFVSQGGLVLGGGLVVERIISTCTEECTDYYPELSISMYF